MLDEKRTLAEYMRWRAYQLSDEVAYSMLSFPETKPAGTWKSLTWVDTHDLAVSIAGEILSRTGAGDRVAIMLPQGTDYVASFLGCLYAGVIAVPLPAHGHAVHDARSAAALVDSEPSVLLTDSRSIDALRAWTAEQGIVVRHTLAVDRLPMAVKPVSLPAPALEEVAYLQYTSGSTREPAGVMVTHRNLVANARQAASAYLEDRLAGPTTGVSWLPLFHDMGLVLGIALPLVGGYPSLLMDPADFLRAPARWLRLLSRVPGAITGAPNFAYDYLLDKVPETELLSADLSRIRVMINGSEPVRPKTVSRFQRTLGRAGLRPEAHCPSYGLAEATVFVSTDPVNRPPETVMLDRSALEKGRILESSPADPTAVSAVTCGQPTGQQVCVVRPGSDTPADPDEVGEIAVSGPNVGVGYWRRDGSSAHTFATRVGHKDGVWLRTGDLGVLYHGRLLITGRLKDLIIMDGRNHYPQDLEQTVQEAVQWIRRDHLAAFSVDLDEHAAPGLVVVAEQRHGLVLGLEDCQEAVRQARGALSHHHGLRLQALHVAPPGTVPRTSSGKVSRSACKALYLSGDLGIGGRLS
ncbi:fatty acyl-AMP ligase [Streptomyces sp. NPDC054887]